jgi:hypothetical protein
MKKNSIYNLNLMPTKRHNLFSKGHCSLLVD